MISDASTNAAGARGSGALATPSGERSPGLIYTSDVTFPRPTAYVSRLVTALTDAATRHETVRHGGVLWLRSPG